MFNSMLKILGISWGADLSFRWIYVSDVDPVGEAAQSGLIRKGTEEIDIVNYFLVNLIHSVGDYIIEIGNTTTLGADFDFVLNVYTYLFFN